MKAKLFLKAHSVEILTAGTITGLVATVISAIKATPKALESIDELQSRNGCPLTSFEKVKCAAPFYIPTLLTGLATSACSIAVSSKNKYVVTSLSGSYALIADQYRRYKLSAKDIFGEDGHRAIVEHMDVAEKKDVCLYSNGIVAHGFELPDESQKYLFFDSICEIFFEAAYEEVLSAIYHLNRNFSGRGYLSVDEYCEFLGIECHSMLGWTVTDFDIPSLDISIFKGNKAGKACYILTPLFDPSPDYMNDWL